MKRMFSPIVRLCLLILALVALAGCLPPGATSAPAREAKPTVRVGSTNFNEQIVLAELYAQALEENGYRIERRLNLGSRESVEPALESGQIHLYPEYLATMLAFVTRGADRGSSDADATHRRLHEVLRPQGIAVLEYAPAVNTNGFVVTRATADKYRLAKLSDLAPVASQLVLGASPECPVRPFCIPGLRQVYGITFKDFRILDPGGPLTVGALESGLIDVGVLFTTDPLISAKSFVLLADDQNLQLADNVAPVVRADFLGRAPADFQPTLNAVSAQLTTAELTQLNARVALERQAPHDAADAWLRAKGLAK